MFEDWAITIVSGDVDSDVAVDVWGGGFLNDVVAAVDLCATGDGWDLGVFAGASGNEFVELVGFGVDCAFTDITLSRTDNTTMQNTTLMNELSNPELLKVKSPSFFIVLFMMIFYLGAKNPGEPE